jgi:hypothetical protein
MKPAGSTVSSAPIEWAIASSIYQSTRSIQHAAVLADVKTKPSVAAKAASLDIGCARRRVGTRSGREKACGAVELEK